MKLQLYLARLWAKSEGTACLLIPGVWREPLGPPDTDTSHPGTSKQSFCLCSKMIITFPGTLQPWDVSKNGSSMK